MGQKFYYLGSNVFKIMWEVLKHDNKHFEWARNHRVILLLNIVMMVGKYGGWIPILNVSDYVIFGDS